MDGGEEELTDNFIIKCRKCGYEGEAKDIIAEVDLWVEPQSYMVTHKEVTMKCSSCGYIEIIDKSPAW